MNTKYVTFAGDFLKKTEVDILRPIEGILTAIGEEATKKMKSFTEPHDYRGDAPGGLTGSITWRTKTNHGAINDTNDLIDAPPVHAVDIGSANDHAIYRERGTGPHLNPDGTNEFVAEIKEWAASKGYSEDIAWAIIKTIRNQGTDEAPFAEPTARQLRSISRPICEKAIKEYWATQRQV